MDILPDQAAAFGPLVYLLIFAIVVLAGALAWLVRMIFNKLFRMVEANTAAFTANTSAVQSLTESVDRMNEHLSVNGTNGPEFRARHRAGR